MAEKKGKGGSKSTTTKSSERVLPQGSVSLGVSPQATNLPALLMGGMPLAGEADVTGAMAESAPVFGQVLNSIGIGVVTSQEALDEGLVETAKILSNTKIDLITHVVQNLNEDGLPEILDPEESIRKQNVSLINYINPQAHQWNHVALSMDLAVGEIDNETGFTFNSTQKSSSVSTTGLLWGFIGWFDHKYSKTTTEVTHTTDHEAAWARGQVRMDAMLTPRRTGKFDAPAEVSIGPQISIGIGGVTETETEGVITRGVALTISVRKADGSVNPDQTLNITSSQFAIELLDNENPSGVFNATNADGVVLCRAKRTIPGAIFGRPIRGTVTVRLGEVTRDVEINL